MEVQKEEKSEYLDNMEKDFGEEKELDKSNTVHSPSADDSTNGEYIAGNESEKIKSEPMESTSSAAASPTKNSVTEPPPDHSVSNSSTTKKYNPQQSPEMNLDTVQKVLLSNLLTFSQNSSRDEKSTYFESDHKRDLTKENTFLEKSRKLKKTPLLGPRHTPTDDQ